MCCCCGWELDPYYYRRMAEQINSAPIPYTIANMIDIEGEPVFRQPLNQIMRIKNYHYMITNKYSWNRIIVYTTMNYTYNTEVIILAVPM